MRPSHILAVSVIFTFAATALPATAGQQSAAETDVLVVDAKAPSHPFPHFWEQMFGSGRAILSLRDSYRGDLRAVKQITDFTYVRFHAIFDDEVGIYGEDSEGHPLYNFSYIDQIYDGLLANGVRPFVEISFMPNQLAASHTLHPFWYHPNISPPKDWGRWDGLVAAFARHLVERYGIDEVSQWYFEVWNEPNLDFWAGQPKQETYWELYDQTATTIKKVSARLRVGGPATAQAAWVDCLHPALRPRSGFPWITFPLTSTPTIRRKTSSGRKQIFLATRWSAEQSTKCTTRSSHRRCPSCR